MKGCEGLNFCGGSNKQRLEMLSEDDDSKVGMSIHFQAVNMLQYSPRYFKNIFPF